MSPHIRAPPPLGPPLPQKLSGLLHRQPRTRRRLASELASEHPGAAASIREGLEETLTLQRLGIEGAPYRTLRSTHTIESLNRSVATYTRNVKRWRGGSMLVRWVSASVLDASQRFRRIRGHRDLTRLVAVLQKIENQEEDAFNAQVA